MVATGTPVYTEQQLAKLAGDTPAVLTLVPALADALALLAKDNPELREKTDIVLEALRGPMERMENITQSFSVTLPVTFSLQPGEVVSNEEAVTKVMGFIEEQKLINLLTQKYRIGTITVGEASVEKRQPTVEEMTIDPTDPEPPHPVRDLNCRTGLDCECMAAKEWKQWNERHQKRIALAQQAAAAAERAAAKGK